MRILIVVVVGALTAVGGAAWGQNRARKGDRIQQLTEKVDRALEASAGSAEAKEAMKQLKQELKTLKREVQQLKAANAADGDVGRRLLLLEKKLETLDLKLSTLKLDMLSTGRTAGYRDGFYLQSPNRDYLLRIRGLLQTAYMAQIYSDRKTYSGGTLGENVSTFALRRARLELSGNVISKILRYRLELDFGSEDPGPLLQAYGEMLFVDFLNLRFGQQKIPISRQMLLHSANTLFSDRSSVVRDFAPGWDLGLVAFGTIPVLGAIRYQLGIFNGAGSMAPVDDNTDFLYAVRLLFEPWGPVIDDQRPDGGRTFSLSVGGSFAYNLAPTDIQLRTGETDPTKAAALRDVDGDGRVDNVGIFLVGAELTARMRIVLWQTEFFYRHEDPGAAGDSRNFYGLYTQLGVVPRLTNYEVAVRYGYWRPHHYGQQRTLPVPDQVHEVSAVIAFFFWKHRVKSLLEYTFQYMEDLESASQQKLDELMVHKITLQAQVYF